MLFCKSSTVKVGTIALICTASCVVATIASSLVSSCFVHPQASGLRPDLSSAAVRKEFCGGQIARAAVVKFSSGLGYCAPQSSRVVDVELACWSWIGDVGPCCTRKEQRRGDRGIRPGRAQGAHEHEAEEHDLPLVRQGRAGGGALLRRHL